MSHLTPELQIVLFDDEEEQPQNYKPTKKQSQIFVFDDEDCLDLEEESLSPNIEPSKDLRGERKVMTGEEYRKKCNEIQEKIIMSSLVNFSLPKKAQGNFFKEAKQKRKSNQLIYERRKSRCVDDFLFDPKSADVKVSFANKDSEVNHIASSRRQYKQNIRPIEQCLNDEIIAPLPETPSQKVKNSSQKRPSLNGACIQKKSDLTISEDKTKNILKVSNFREFLYTQLKSDYSIYLRIRKTQSGFINSTYKVYFQQNNRFIMACEKQGLSKYVFSTSEVHIREDHISYLGKLQSNFFGSEFVMYDSGEEYSKTKMLENYKKQLTYIQYSQPQNSPRNILAYITSTDNKSTDFTILDNNGNAIRSRWNNGIKKHLCRLDSKQPTYDPNQYNFKLDFSGLAGIPSTKNFILENEEYSDALIFGRQADRDSYLLKVKAPLSIMQAVGIAMSSIHYKFL